MRTETTRYEAAHGKKPRGTGNWAFDFEGYKAGERAEMVFAYGTLTEAKAKAARTLSFTPRVCYVLS